jgi:hypothetical protein
MSSTSLIRVYVCTALARSFLNLDVLWYIMLERRAAGLNDNERDNNNTHGGWGLSPAGESSRRMRDDKLHRLYLPLTCAMKLCDSIRPERLAYIAADYLADILPLYSTGEMHLAPCVPRVLMECSQLPSCSNMVKISRASLLGRIGTRWSVSRVMFHSFSSFHTLINRKKTWVNWTHQTLGLVEETKHLLAQMQSTGKLVESFKRSSSIPCEVLNVIIIPARTLPIYSPRTSHNR